jgi:spore maturation protein CgeB
MFSPLSRIVDKVIFLGPIEECRANSFDRVLWKLNFEIDHQKLNKRLIELCEKESPDFCFIVKGTYLYPSTLKKLKAKNVKLINWSLDDMYAMHNRTFNYDRGLKFYDLVVTAKSYNVNELKKLGAGNILFQYQAYDKDVHKPYENCKDKLWDVVFIGSYEKERFESIKFLAQNGIKINLWGYGWVFLKNKYENIIYMGGELFKEEYAKIFTCSKISLNFLRKINRDLHTSRSIEIPACKGFMLAERTDEHKKLFTEDKEAVYYSGNRELFEKVSYYLSHVDERIKITEAGYRRCINSNYSYDDRIKGIIAKINFYS